jgi:hypothetical protein
MAPATGVLGRVDTFSMLVMLKSQLNRWSMLALVGSLKPIGTVGMGGVGTTRPPASMLCPLSLRLK